MNYIWKIFKDCIFGMHCIIHLTTTPSNSHEHNFTLKKNYLIHSIPGRIFVCKGYNTPRAIFYLHSFSMTLHLGFELEICAYHMYFKCLSNIYWLNHFSKLIPVF